MSLQGAPPRVPSDRSKHRQGKAAEDRRCAAAKPNADTELHAMPDQASDHSQQHVGPHDKTLGEAEPEWESAESQQLRSGTEAGAAPPQVL